MLEDPRLCHIVLVKHFLWTTRQKNKLHRKLPRIMEGGLRRRTSRFIHEPRSDQHPPSPIDVLLHSPYKAEWNLLVSRSPRMIYWIPFLAFIIFSILSFHRFKWQLTGGTSFFFFLLGYPEALLWVSIVTTGLGLMVITSYIKDRTVSNTCLTSGTGTGPGPTSLIHSL